MRTIEDIEQEIETIQEKLLVLAQSSRRIDMVNTRTTYVIYYHMKLDSLTRELEKLQKKNK